LIASTGTKAKGALPLSYFIDVSVSLLFVYYTTL